MKIQYCAVDDPEFDGIVRNFFTLFQRHLIFEESHLHPLLTGLDPDRSHVMVSILQQAKTLAPPRPHPEFPNSLATFGLCAIIQTNKSRATDQFFGEVEGHWQII